MQFPILVVDDEAEFLASVELALLKSGYEDVALATDALEAKARLEQREFAAVLLDQAMPGMSGLDLLEFIKERTPETECVMLTADERPETIVRAVKLGAYDYLVKPITPNRLLHTLERVAERRRLLQALSLRAPGAAPEALRSPEAFAAIVAVDPRMTALLREAELHAASDIPILITGETGVGKELLARAIHRASRRADGPFFAVNMLAISPHLFESEFFGHTRGAFTGADRERHGHLAQARGGTLFLDEIGDLPPEVQGKLLRLIQEGEYLPVGRSTPAKAQVRFIAATNKDLRAAVKAGRFRKDLFYRLQFATLHIPPLRERPADLPAIAAAMLAETSAKHRLSAAALVRLQQHGFPGNVRELKGLLEAATNLAQGEKTVEPRHLRLPAGESHVQTVPEHAPAGDGMESMAAVERRHIMHIYERTGRNKTQTAKILDIGLRTLHRKLHEYDAK